MRTKARKRATVALSFALVASLAACRRDDVGIIQSLRDGQMQDFGATTNVTGGLPVDWPEGGELKVQGVVTPYADKASDSNRSWTATVTMDTTNRVTEITAQYFQGGIEYRQILSVIDHAAIPDALGSYAVDGVGMRFTNTGLAGLGPIIQNLASGSFDLNAMLVGQPINTSDANGSIYEAGAGNIGLVPVSTSSGVRATVTIQDMFVGVDLNVTTLGIGNCRLDVTVPSVTIDGYYDMAPAGDDANNVDVNLLGGTPGATNRLPAISIPTINYEFTSGACDPDTPLIGGIISSIAGSSVPDAMRSAFTDELKDPDMAGPLDSPIADAVETALSGISIAGAVGGAVNAHLDSPLQDITENSSGITFRSNADFGTVDPDTLASTCPAVAGAPDIQETATIPSTFPTLGATTPVGGQPYGLGLAISSSAFNQMIGAMTECGLINSTITSFSGMPLTPALLSFLMPQFAQLIPPGTSEIEIRVRPTSGPYLTGNPGPNGEPAELAISNLHLDFMQTKLLPTGGGPEVTVPGGFKWLTVAIDTSFGFDLVWDAPTTSLKPTLTAPPVSAVRARVVYNSIQTNELPTETLFQGLFPQVSAGLTDTFAAFPLPSFLGLSINVLEIAKTNNTYVLYANLDAAPATKATNYTFTDQSTGNYDADDALSDSNEWRHRIRKTWGTTAGNALFQSSLNADSGLSDEVATATGSYRSNFTVVPATPGGAWRLELTNSILGAYTCNNEGNGSCRSQFDSGVTATVTVNGTPQTFNFTPSPSGVGQPSGGTNTQFSGSSSRTVTGTGNATIQISYAFGQRAGSYCSTTFGICSGTGDEASVRMGLSDTLSNGFTIGAYPGVGSRVQANDGHRSSWKVCTDTGAACP